MELTLHHAHDWNVTPGEAKAIQRELAAQVRAVSLEGPIETIAGVDVSIRGDTAQAAISVLRVEDLEVIDEAVYRATVPFPYVPGLLSFREVPVILPALERLSVVPGVFMCDSQGLAHPRRFGLACHLGVLLDWPTFGVAKSRLTGRRKGTLDEEKGTHVPLIDRGEEIGAVLRTRSGIKPVYVSIGHRITLDEALELTLQCAPRYKIPEPTRAAHKLSRREA